MWSMVGGESTNLCILSFSFEIPHHSLTETMYPMRRKFRKENSPYRPVMCKNIFVMSSYGIGNQLLLYHLYNPSWDSGDVTSSWSLHFDFCYSPTYYKHIYRPKKAKVPTIPRCNLVGIPPDIRSENSFLSRKIKRSWDFDDSSCLQFYLSCLPTVIYDRGWSSVTKIEHLYVWS